MRYTKQILQDAVNLSNNYSDLLRELGLSLYAGNRDTVKKYIGIFGIDTKHFRTLPIKRNSVTSKLELSDVLVENSSYSRTHLKKRLYSSGIKTRCCEMCGQTEEWKGKKMSLILDHINGIYNDNRIENLRIVCPNCNSTLDTHCGKNVKYKKEKKCDDELKTPKDVKINTCGCGNEISKSAVKCVSCYNLDKRKVKNRPSYMQLMIDIELLGYLGTGKKYNVSDNAIRKWVINYENELK